MLKHSLIIALRNLRKGNSITILNIVGLTLGLACSMVIGLYVVQELSYEKGFSKSDRTYRVSTRFFGSYNATSSQNLASVLSEQPEFEVATKLSKVFNGTVTLEGKSFIANNYYAIDSSFNNVFDYELLYGVRGAAFKNENSLILTTEEAERLFGRHDVVGEFLLVNDVKSEVTGVLKPSFYKSHLEFRALQVRKTSPYDDFFWRVLGNHTYAVTYKNVNQEQVENRLDQIREDYLFPSLSKMVTQNTLEEWLENPTKGPDLSSQRIADIHLGPRKVRELAKGGNRNAVLAFAIIALFILVISCANFINLSTAKASERTKELGVKKVLGTSRRVLIIQILGESVLHTVFAGICALGLTELALTLMQSYFPDFITLSISQYPIMILVLIAAVVMVGVFAGMYPAWYLSSFKINALLKGQKIKGFSGANAAGWFRNILVLAQFTLSATLIIGAIFILRQIDHLQKMDLGFNDENVLVINNAFDLGERGADIPAFLNEIERLSFVENTATFFRIPGHQDGAVKTLQELSNGKELYFDHIDGSSDLIEMLGIKLLYGRLMSDSLESDQDAIIINEAAAAHFEGSNVIGSKVGDRVVIGVVEDFHFESLRTEVGPASIQISENRIKIGIRMPLTQANISEVSDKWHTFQSKPLDYGTLSENYGGLLNKERQIGAAFTLFTVLAIIISCLGLFGLAAFAADQRLKEFGIRKVLGASVVDIVSVFSYDFMRIIGIAFLISIPLSIWGVNQWLQGFSDRISLSVGVFILAGVLAIGIAFVTILFQSIKTGKLNPVDTIKNE